MPADVKCLKLLALPMIAAAVLTGCQTERPIVAPAEPTWDYRDGETQLSNNDAWEQMIPATVLVYDASQVASLTPSPESIVAFDQGVDAIAKLKGEITTRLAAGGLLDQEVRDRAAREIRGRAATLYRQGHWASKIEQEMWQLDVQILQPLLEELADLISPETAGEAVDRPWS